MSLDDVLETFVPFKTACFNRIRHQLNPCLFLPQLVVQLAILDAYESTGTVNKALEVDQWNKLNPSENQYGRERPRLSAVCYTCPNFRKFFEQNQTRVAIFLQKEANCWKSSAP